MDKVVPSAGEAVADVFDGASIAIGGFGLCGVPSVLIDALLAQGATNLETVSNNCGVDGLGLGVLLEAHRIRRHTGSYVGENQEYERQYLTVRSRSSSARRERWPNGCARAVPASLRFSRPSGIGTQVADGGIPRRYHPDGTIDVLERAQRGARIRRQELRARTRHRHRLRAGARMEGRPPRQPRVSKDRDATSIPLCATAGKITIAEVELLLEPGEIDADEVDTPGIFVQRIVPHARRREAHRASHDVSRAGA